MKTEQTSPFNKFYKEFKKLLSMYHNIHEFYFSADYRKIHRDIRKRKSEITITSKNKILNTLRQTIFVRLISALEVFLLDNIRLIFLYDVTPFLDDGKIELSKSYLLNETNIQEIHSRIINGEIRELGNSGFDKIIKFFKEKST